MGKWIRFHLQALKTLTTLSVFECTLSSNKISIVILLISLKYQSWGRWGTNEVFDPSWATSSSSYRFKRQVSVDSSSLEVACWLCSHPISVHSDLYITVQVWAGSKPLSIPIQTAYKPFRSERRWVSSWCANRGLSSDLSGGIDGMNGYSSLWPTVRFRLTHTLPSPYGTCSQLGPKMGLTTQFLLVEPPFPYLVVTIKSKKAARNASFTGINILMERTTRLQPQQMSWDGNPFQEAIRLRNMI